MIVEYTHIAAVLPVDEDRLRYSEPILVQYIGANLFLFETHCRKARVQKLKVAVHHLECY